MIHDENKELTDDELIIHKDFLKLSKYALFYIWKEHPVRLNFFMLYIKMDI